MRTNEHTPTTDGIDTGSGDRLRYREQTADAEVSLPPETEGFRPATEYFDPDIPDPDDGSAVTVVWYDQETPLFVCEEHYEHVAPLKWEGSARADDYERIRTEARDRLYDDGAPCCVCYDLLPEVIG